MSRDKHHGAFAPDDRPRKKPDPAEKRPKLKRVKTRAAERTITVREYDDK